MQVLNVEISANSIHVDIIIHTCICSVIVEALKVDSMQRLCSSLEPMLRRIVSSTFHFS